ncbi:hypothetical protein BD770DRAFT_383111 [Pilaira anomala]|nr:hypothetical protein BD770DRAFT_383111 [Pilaira anomala]
MLLVRTKRNLIVVLVFMYISGFFFFILMFVSVVISYYMHTSFEYVNRDLFKI